MKKIYPVLLFTGLLALTGCSDKYTNVSNSSEVVMSVNKVKYTRGDIYEMIQSYNVDSFVVNQAKLLLNSTIEITDDMKAEAEVKYTNALGTSDETPFLTDAGYATKEEYIENEIYPTLQEAVAVKAYVSENYDTLASDALLKKVRIIEVSSESDGEAAIKAIQEGATFDSVAETYNVSTTYTGAEVISTTDTAASAANIMPTQVATDISALTTPQLMTSVISDSTTSKLFVVQVTATSPGVFKDAGVDFLASLTTYVDKYYAATLPAAGFKVYDKGIYDAVKAGDYADYLDQ